MSSRPVCPVPDRGGSGRCADDVVLIARQGFVCRRCFGRAPAQHVGEGGRVAGPERVGQEASTLRSLFIAGRLASRRARALGTGPDGSHHALERIHKSFAQGIRALPYDGGRLVPTGTEGPHALE